MLLFGRLCLTLAAEPNVHAGVGFPRGNSGALRAFGVCIGTLFAAAKGLNAKGFATAPTVISNSAIPATFRVTLFSPCVNSMFDDGSIDLTETFSDIAAGVQGCVCLGSEG